MVYLISYGGLLFDLLIVPLLLWRRTRPLAFLVALAFHLTNWYLFNIGIFPWLMIAATLLFFPPSWPEDDSCAPGEHSTLACRVRAARLRAAEASGCCRPPSRSR